MKHILSITIGLMLLALPANAGETLKPWQEKALQLIKQEKKVLDARWKMPSRNVLHVAMKPDGTRHDGFAEYLCMLFGDAGAPKGELKSVFIFDPATYKAYLEGGSGRHMGMALCR